MWDWHTCCSKKVKRRDLICSFPIPSWDVEAEGAPGPNPSLGRRGREEEPAANVHWILLARYIREEIKLKVMWERSDLGKFHRVLLGHNTKAAGPWTIL